MQDMEFTVEAGKLYMLQTRNGKRTAPAALKIACDLVDEGMIDEKQAVAMIEPRTLDTIMMYSGRRAEHDINGRMSIVIRRERWLSTVRVAMMAGTLHPKPIIRGMNDLP